MKPIASILAFILLLLLAGCNDSSPASRAGVDLSSRPSMSDPVKVSVTVGMVADIVRLVGGEHVDVDQICGPGVDPHLYKVTRDDVQALMAADMIFYSGLMLEGKMSDTLVKIARSKPVVPITEALDESVLLEPDDFAGHFDPHVWMDVSAWSQCVDVVRDELIAASPEHKTDFTENAASLREQLGMLHEYGLQSLKTIPEQSRVLITSHDAFNYFGRAYGLEVLGVQGISTESEAGLQRINDLVDLLVKKNVRAVFVESSVSPKNIQALVEGARSKGHQVRIGEKELFGDAMGAEGTYEGTYIGMLDHNITLVTRGLGGDAPAEGLNGRLTP